MDTLILYGTETGTPEDLAEQLAELFDIHSVPHRYLHLSHIDLSTLYQYSKIFIIVSSYGDEDSLFQATKLFKELKKTTPGSLSDKDFAVFALGDSGYQQFCKAGKKIEQLLIRSGANRLIKRVDADIDYEQPFDLWSKEVVSHTYQYAKG